MSSWAAPALTTEEFQAFCEFLYRRTGMSFTDSRRYYVDRRLAERMAATGAASFRNYFAQLRGDIGSELEQLINSLTVNETYFYREDHQFRCLTSDMLASILATKRRGEAIRIWSAPCSTGEEAYSIAMWLLENWPPVDEHDVEIVGSDIDTRVLERAEAGVYGPRALMRLPPDLVGRYFEKIGDDRYRLDEGLRGSVRFTPVNLSDARAVRGQGVFDVIFCRNMLIYFDDASRRETAENLYECLRPGGYICLGHTESMSRISPLFRVCRFPDAIVYQRPGKGSDV